MLQHPLIVSLSSYTGIQVSDHKSTEESVQHIIAGKWFSTGEYYKKREVIQSSSVSLLRVISLSALSGALILGLSSVSSERRLPLCFSLPRALLRGPGSWGWEPVRGREGVASETVVDRVVRR